VDQKIFHILSTAHKKTVAMHAHKQVRGTHSHEMQSKRLAAATFYLRCCLTHHPTSAFLFNPNIDTSGCCCCCCCCYIQCNAHLLQGQQRLRSPPERLGGHLIADLANLGPRMEWVRDTLCRWPGGPVGATHKYQVDLFEHQGRLPWLALLSASLFPNTQCDRLRPCANPRQALTDTHQACKRELAD
jgi:hypothetical protein